MAAVVARAEVVFQLCAEFLGDSDVFYKDAVLAVGVVVGERRRRDVLGYPGWVTALAVVGGCQRSGWSQVVDWAREAILEETVGVNEGCAVCSSGCGRGGDGRDWGWS